ncbi:hypothetical protein CLV62_12581 [Dysgonomonas alginatilytica]|uniref:Uncharacterized protein n=1 Tax=Dysgonomonas alginatilytica TaxID=1605892 RepID=A0A2V3PMC4_9BACT|nr:hypothetical protein [Dysgonomonas alginatilytica]PXV61248.1 hypothetical protein CLV62_12581 [Dysgonomonas alginatilytica]
MKTKQTAYVFTDCDGLKHPFEYETLESLFEEIYKLWNEDYPEEVDFKVTLPDGNSFWLNLTLMHYCFSKGRISTTELIELIFEEKEAQA